MNNEAVLNPQEEAFAVAVAAAVVAAAGDHDQNFTSSGPIPFAIRNWVFGTALGVLVILIQIAYQDNKGVLILFDTVHRVNMEFMISALILFLWASVAERTNISCFGWCECCVTATAWKRLFGHLADVLGSFIIGLLISVLPSSVKVAKCIAYIVCAGPTIRLFIIFLVIPLVDFIIYKYCCFEHIGGEDNNGAAGAGNNGEGGEDGGYESNENGVGGGGDDNSSTGAIQMSSLGSASSVV